MLVVSQIANREDQWVEVMIALIKRIPMNDPLGATVIAILLDECSLPPKELLEQLIKRVCANNRSRMKFLESIIDKNLKRMNKQVENRTISSPIQTHVGQVADLSDDNDDANEATPTIDTQQK